MKEGKIYKNIKEKICIKLANNDASVFWKGRNMIWAKVITQALSRSEQYRDNLTAAKTTSAHV
jgi:hypothetical protein